ncbi:MAG: SusC/RagA family TonB-linked outer membrane protein, partial [Flavobacterium sp.]|nr:SusC/RagA family TonB-linked outer membrane protein [Flavobacterium sp.]
SGVVSDATGPIPGANVVVKGTKRGTQTDVDGKYSIKAKQGETLVYSYIGLADTERPVGASNTITLTLKPSTTVLDDVLITGAVGIKRKKDAITSVSQLVTSKELTQAGSPNVIQSLAGKVSGLQINTISNGASPDTKILLRGTRSITGNNSALVVIDNVISSASILAQLPPDSVESVNILKGQQGGALYGDQGSNGVLIVTTKKGTKDSKITVSLNSSVDFQTISFLPKRQTQYGQGWGLNGAYDFDFPGADPRNNDDHFSPYENGAWGPSFDDPNFANTIVPTGLPQADGKFLTDVYKSRGSDNIKDFFKTGTILQNNVSINAGSLDSGYVLFSYGRQTTDFVVQNDALKRNTFILRAGKKINKFRIGTNINYISQSLTQTDSNLFDDLLQTPTNIDVNRFRDSGHQGHWTVYAKNPFQTIKQTRFDDLTDLVNTAVDLSYDFNKHISINYNGSVNLRSVQSQSHEDGFTKVFNYVYDFSPYVDNQQGSSPTYESLGGSPINSSYFISQSFGRNYYGDLLLNFDYDLTKDISFKLNLGNNIQDNYFRINTQGGTNLDTFGYYDIKNVLQRTNPGLLSNFSTLYRKVAFFANLDLGYKDYLFLNATARYEKSSAVIKSAFYPSVGLSFVPTKAFDGLKKNDILNYFKLTASYVSVGNSSPVPAYATNNTAQLVGGYPYADLISYQVRRNQTNKMIKPETVTTLEFGATLGFFKDRITLDGSYYNTETKDLITQATSSRATGLTSILDNTGSLTDKGYEIDLGITPIRSKDNGFNWNIRTSYSRSKTIVTSLSNGVNSVNLASNTFIGVFAEVGEQFPLIKGTAYVRDPDGNIIVGADGLPKRTTTFEKLGKSTPDYIIGLTNTFSYKGVSLKAVADYRTGHSFYSEAYDRMAFAGYTEESASQDRFVGYVVPNSVQLVAGNYVQNTTPVNGGGSAGTLNYFNQRYNSTGEALLVDATALKIREISLSYDLPKKMLKDTGVSSFTFGVNARNPFVFFFNTGHGIKNRGFADPEANSSSGNAIGLANVGQYPTTKTYGFSINVTF